MVGTTHRVSCYLPHPGLVQLCPDGVPRVCAYSITVEESPAWLGDDNRRSVSCDRFPLPAPDKAPGLSLLYYVPRLPLMMAVLFAIYALMWPRKRNWDWSHYAWSA